MHASPPPGLLADELAPLLAGTPYRPLRLIGKGGMGEVYEIEHEFLGRHFAFKVMHPFLARDAQFADRMRIEAQVTGRLRHPAAVEVIDFWVAAGRPCIVMELLRGRSLAQELRERIRLPTLEAVQIGIEALSALHAAHAVGVVHRDIKPENLFLHELPSGRELKILDFGLARIVPRLALDTPPTLLVPTATGAMVGTPRFMSPEAERGRRVDTRADLYSLGVVLYVALAGHAPFDEDAGPAEPPSTYMSEGAPLAFDAVILKAIAERIEDRYQTAEEFRNALLPFTPRKAGLPLANCRRAHAERESP
ncbi:MAG: serine/threonine-protein kinase [Myxococcota bacterium]